MKTLLIALALAFATQAMAQDYQAQPWYYQGATTAAETRRLHGVSDFIQDGPRYNILKLVPTPEQIITNHFTNSLVLFRSTSALTNCFLQMGSPTNKQRYAIQVFSLGNLTTVLTTSNITTGTTAITNSGPGFESTTNLLVLAYTIPTNSSAWVISTGTNWQVVPGNK